MSGRIETFTSDAESSKWSKNKDINVVEAGVDIGDGSSGGGSDVQVDQVVTSGREVAGVTVDGERTAILIPNAGEWTQSDWAEADPSDDAYIKNKPSLAQVATSGDYGDLDNTPDLSNFVEDSNYVHTDHNYDAGAKNIVDHVTDNLAGKVDKVSGKGLSDNNFTNAQKDKLTNLADIYGVGSNLTLDPETNILSANAQPITIDTEMSSSSTNAVQNRVITGALADKVDKVSGKGLSANDFTNAYKDKLDGIDQGAEVNDISTISVNGVNVPTDANKNIDLQIPTKVSDLSNDSGFITNTVTNLTNYYLKSETYTQAEINALIAAITTLDIEVVNALPVSDISTTTIYLVPKTTAGTQDVYDEWINIDGTSSGWEHIGSTEIDLTNYYTKSEVNTLLSAKANSSDLATVATSGSYNDLSDKPTIPTVNNGVLTITQNGATLGTFSANQNNNATIDIPGGSSGAGAALLNYGQSTWAEVLNAAQAGKALYCMVINGNVGIVAGLSKITVSGGNYTEFEFQYHSSETHTAVNPTDKLYTYKITNAGVWSTTSTNIADISSGLLPHLIIHTPTGSTVTATKGLTVITATETSEGVYECDVPEYGNWTISDGTDSNILKVNTVSVYDTYVNNGATILPTDDVTIWLRCGSRTEEYTTVSEILADQVCLSALMNDHNAVDYMIRSTSFINNVCSNASAMNFAGLNNYAANAMINDINWLTGVSDSDYIDYVLNGKVPVMTSNTTPEGVVTCGVMSSGNASRAYLLFDGNPSTENSQYYGAASPSSSVIWDQYQFTKKVKVKVFRMLFGQSNVTSFKIQASDNDTMQDIQTFTGTTYGVNTMHSVVINNDAEYYRWRYQTLGGTPIFKEMQFYYREDY